MIMVLKILRLRRIFVYLA